jgi:ABC-type cobalamin/Fe3+-siderophores transport system ATPase subunit
MKIVKFLAAQVKGLKVVEFNPDPEVVKITGANGAGKSTVLDIIKALFTGDTMPVRKGSAKGLVNIQIGEYNVSWDLKAGETGKVVVKDSKGATMPAPREFLKKMAGNKAIDPLCFIRMDRKDQIKTLFQLVPGLEASLKDINDRYVKVQQQRSNTLALQTKAKVDLSRIPEHAQVPELVICDELAAEVNRMNRQNTLNAERQEEQRDYFKAGRRNNRP